MANEKKGLQPEITARYWNMIPVGVEMRCIPEPGTDLCHLRWMLQELRAPMDSGKAMRWLGFIQGILIERGYTTVQAERDFTRPYLAASTPAKIGELVEHSFNACDLDLAPAVLAKALELAIDRGGQTLPISDYDISRAKVIINGENSEISALRNALTASQAEVASMREELREARMQVIASDGQAQEAFEGQGILRAALEPFAEAGRIIDGTFGPALFADNDMAFHSGCTWSENGKTTTITWGDFRRARAALSTPQRDKQ